MARLLFLGNCLGNCNEDIDGQEADAILVVGREMLEKRNHLLDHNGRGHGLDELCQVVGRLSPDHGGIIVYELAVVLPEEFLRGGCGACIWDVVEASRGDL